MASEPLSYDILLLAHAATKNIQRDSHTFNARSLSDIADVEEDLGEEYGEFLGGDNGHAVPLSANSINLILDYYNDVKVVWTGMISETQAQLAKAFSKNGVKVFGFWDSFHGSKKDKRLFGDNIFGQNFIPRFALYCTQLFVTHEILYKRFVKNLSAKAQPKIALLGHPNIEETQAYVLDKQNSPTFKAQLFQDLNLSTAKPIMVYCGAYGDLYAQQLQVFLQGLEMLKQELSSHQIIICLHPGSNGSIEHRLLNKRATFEELGTSIKIIKMNDIKISHGPDTYDTIDLISFADTLVTYKSTLLSLLTRSQHNKSQRMIYVGTDVDKVFDVKQGFAFGVKDPLDLKKAMSSALPSVPFQQLSPFLVMRDLMPVLSDLQIYQTRALKPLRFTSSCNQCLDEQQKQISAVPRLRFP